MNWLRMPSPAIALVLLALPVFAQMPARQVGIVLSVEGEVVATTPRGQVPLGAYAVIEVGMNLHLAAKARVQLAHNSEKVTYVIAGPAIVTVSQKGLAAQPATAIVSSTGSRAPAELAARGAAPTAGAQTNLRVGGESLESSRAGLAATLKAPEPAKAEAPAAKAAASPGSRSERERLADEEAARKSVGAAGSKAPARVASAAPAGTAASQESNVLYQQALAMEKDGKTVDAIRIYRRAARAGSGKAALRLAEIYDKGIGGVPRDFAESLQWYETARGLGEEVPTAAAR
jgi:hypothetical protein